MKLVKVTGPLDQLNNFMDELCNGTDIVKVTFRLTVGDLIDNEAVAKYNELKLDNIYIQNKVCQYS